MNKQQILNINLINLGHRGNDYLNQPDTPDFTAANKADVKLNCLRFLQECCLQMKEQLNNFKNNFYLSDCISPTNALSPIFHENNPDCIKNLTHLILNIIDNENDVHHIINEWTGLI